MSMKIVQVITALNLGGAQTLLENLCYGLVGEAQDVSVISLSDDHTATARRLEERGVEVRYLGKRPHFDARITGKLADAFQELKPDVIHAHNIRKLYVLGAARKAGIKHVVYTVHNVAQKEQGLLGGLFSGVVFRAGLMVPVGLSPKVTQSIEDRYHLKDVPTIYNGTELERFAKKADYRLHGHPAILNVARLDEQKNHRRLIEAFLKVSRCFPEAELTIVGDGVLMDGLTSLVQEKGIARRVHFEGSQDEVASYFGQSDVFCLSSDYEGMPMTLIEAMAAGMPIVSTNVGGIPDMLQHESSALLTRADSSELADALVRVLSDEDLRSALGEEAYRASRQFSHRSTARQYLDLYRSLTEHR